MLIGKNSQYLLKKVRSKAKMYEYNISENEHIKIEDKVNDLLLIAIGAIGNISATILRNLDTDQNIEELIKINKSDLEFSSKFFDSYLNSKLDYEYEEYHLLMGSIAYFFCDYIGSSKVLINKINREQINLESNGIEKVIVDLLKDEFHIKDYTNIKDEIYKKYILKLSKDLRLFYKLGNLPDIDNIKEFRKFVYLTGSSRELLLVDSLLSIYILKIRYSAKILLPIYTNIDKDIWWKVLSNNKFIRELWPAQRKLGEAGVFRGKSAVIQMPTSSGKTKSISIVIQSAFLSGRTKLAIIVAPFRALCREIRFDLEEDFKFDNSVYVNQMSDILSIDSIELNQYSEDDKTILILTPEKLVYLLRHRGDLIKKIGLIIFDEGHLFDEPHRGLVYELLISMLKGVFEDNVQKILISAVIPNADQINDWINNHEGIVIADNTIKSTEKTISINDWRKRSDQLYGYLHFLNPENPEEEEFFVPRTIKIQNINKIGREKKDRIFPEIDVKKLKAYNNDIAIYYGLNLCVNGGVAIFCGKKDTANKVLERVINIEERGYDISNLAKTSNKDEVFKITNLIYENYGQDNIYYKASQRHIFAHHAGISNGIKISIEYAMKKGYINFIVCTSTLAQGVNLPIRYLIISSFYQGKNQIRVRDFHNLIGRAGRSGIYTEGSVILTEPFIYNKRHNSRSTYEWKWNEYKKLINVKNSEDCSSVLLDIVKSHNINNKCKLNIYNIVYSYYNDEDFEERLIKYKNKIKENYNDIFMDIEDKIRQVFISLDSLENFLMSYLIENDWEKCEENIINILKNTLAYYLANEDEKEKLLNLFIMVSKHCIKSTEDINDRFIYSKALLGIKDIKIINDYIDENIVEILKCNNILDVFLIVFPVIYKILVQKVKINLEVEEAAKEICTKWINGDSYYSILETMKEKNYKIIRRGKPIDFTLDDIIKICDNIFGYESTIIISAISEIVSSKLDDDDTFIIRIFSHLISSLRYGLYSKISIALYELGFSDRIVAQDLGRYIETISDRKINKKQIKKYIKTHTLEIKKILEKYPCIFMDRLNFINN